MKRNADDIPRVQNLPPLRAYCGKVNHTVGCKIKGELTMGFWSGDAEKATRVQQEMLAEYDLDGISNQEDLDSVKKIVAELCGTGLMKIPSIEGTNKSAHLFFQKAMLEQNWIIIRQLDRLNKNMEKILSKEGNA